MRRTGFPSRDAAAPISRVVEAAKLASGCGHGSVSNNGHTERTSGQNRASFRSRALIRVVSYDLCQGIAGLHFDRHIGGDARPVQRFPW